MSEPDDGARLLGGDFFEDETFRGGELMLAELAGKDLIRCRLCNVKLPESRWSGARLEDCVFEDCDLTRAAPAGFSARGVTFVGCKLVGVDWSELAEFPALTFRACDLRYASFVSLKLRKTIFERCNLREAQFIDVDLQEAKFDGSQFADARFERCDLRKASFAGAQDLDLPTQGNRVAGARVPLATALRLARSLGLEVLD